MIDEVFCQSFRTGSLTVFCQGAALSLLPKEGDLVGWRPAALLCLDSKGASSNGLQDVLEITVDTEPTYTIVCMHRTIVDNHFLIWGVLVVSLDQGKAFDRADHSSLCPAFLGVLLLMAVSWLGLIYCMMGLNVRWTASADTRLSSLWSTIQFCYWALAGQVSSWVSRCLVPWELFVFLLQITTISNLDNV